MRIQPFVRFPLITPSDSVDLPGGLTDGILVGTAGDVACVAESGTVVTLKLPAGIHYIRVRRVNSTNTGASNLAAMYLS